MVIVDQFFKKLEIPPPKNRREKAFLRNGFKNLFPFILQEHLTQTEFSSIICNLPTRPVFVFSNIYNNMPYYLE